MLLLRPGAVTVGGVSQEAGATSRLTIEDVAAIKEHVPGIREAAPNVTGRVRVTFGNKNWNTLVRGTGPEYAEMRASEPQVGRFFTEEENQRRTRVALVGLTVVREVFGDQNPVGEMIKLNKVNFQVIGVLPPKVATGFQDQDDVVVIPVLTAMHRLLGKDYVDYIDIEGASADDLQSVSDAVIKYMVVHHKVPLRRAGIDELLLRVTQSVGSHPSPFEGLVQHCATKQSGRIPLRFPPVVERHPQPLAPPLELTVFVQPHPELRPTVDQRLV